jgi:hypothetical protein
MVDRIGDFGGNMKLAMMVQNSSGFSFKTHASGHTWMSFTWLLALLLTSSSSKVFKGKLSSKSQVTMISLAQVVETVRIALRE